MHVNYQQFESALKILKKVVNTRSALPMTRSVHFKLEGGECGVYTTDLTTMIHTSFKLDDEIVNPISFSVDLRALQKTVTSKKCDEIRLDPDLENNQLVVTQKNRSVKLDLAAGEAPEVPSYQSFDQKIFARFRTSDWLALRAQVVPFAATDDSRPALSGVFTHRTGDSVTCAAANGFILGTARFELEYDAEFDPMIIPAYALMMIPEKINGSFQMLARNEMSVGLSFTYQSQPYRMYVKLIDGHFPDYQQLVPRETEAVIEIRKDAILEAASSNLTDDLLTLLPRRATGKALEIGEYEWGKNAVRLHGVEKTAFNVQYLMKLLAYAPEGSKYLTLRGSNPESAWTVRAPFAQAVIMPMVVKNEDERRAA